MDIVLPLLGVLLLILLFYDVLVTVFHPQGQGGPLNRTLTRIVWSGFRVIGRRGDGTPRPVVLSFAGPILAVLTIAVWTITLIAGFAFVFYPSLGAFEATSGSFRSGWVAAVYFSGYVASTLGIGNLVPASPLLQILTVVEALGGFVLFTMGVTYVLGVYRSLGLATTLAMDIAGSFQGVDLVRGAETSPDARNRPSEDWVGRTARALSRVTQSHAHYPVLHYFHSSRPDQALQIQLGCLIDLLRGPGPGGRSTSAVSRYSSAALRSALEAYIDEVEDAVIPAGFEPIGERAACASLERRHNRALNYMLYVPPPDREGRGG